MKAVLGSVLFFVIATFVYVGVLFRNAGRRNVAIGLNALLSLTVLNPMYWIAFAVVLFIGWKLAAWRGH